MTVEFNLKRVALWSLLSVGVLAGLVRAFWPQPLQVDIITVDPGPMTVTVADEGETRVTDVFVVSAPIAGRVRRIEAEPGDRLVANETLVAQIEPTDPVLLDPRSEAQAKAALNASESSAALARAELDKAEAELEFARAELKRSRQLASNGTISESEMDKAERSYKTSLAAFAMTQAELQVRNYELTRARAELMSPAEASELRDSCACVSILSPVDGRILQVSNESERIVSAGEPLVEIGDPEQLEIVVDILSSDAVRVQAGQNAFIDGWGGEARLKARVRRVEPFGFTKVSALGIEEQRVNVILDIASPREDWQRLGHGYQVDARIVLWESQDAIKVPLTALFRDGDRWAIFVSENDRAAQRIVEVGHRSEHDAEILQGLEAGEQVLVYPSESVEVGTRLERRL